MLNVQSAKRDSAVDIASEQRNEPPKFGFPKIGAANHSLVYLLRSPAKKNITINPLLEIFLMKRFGNMARRTLGIDNIDLESSHRWASERIFFVKSAFPLIL